MEYRQAIAGEQLAANPFAHVDMLVDMLVNLLANILANRLVEWRCNTNLFFLSCSIDVQQTHNTYARK